MVKMAIRDERCLADHVDECSLEKERLTSDLRSVRCAGCVIIEGQRVRQVTEQRCPQAVSVFRMLPLVDSAWHLP